MKRGLIVGKFYPPHRGHKHLIDFARANTDHLNVILCYRPREDPTGEIRAAWLREIHPGVDVLLIDDKYDAADSKVWAENSIACLGYAPDVVFTSEDYGDPFASWLGCEHVLVDRKRLTVPISATQVRRDPLGCWDFLEPAVRGFYAKRVCLAGAESTGKTTLATALAAHYDTSWAPEYAREYCEGREERDWQSDEFAHIAGTQCRREDEAARSANRLLICDTDAFATSIWHLRHVGSRSAEVEAIANAHRRPDLYLLTDINVPFTQDGTRDGESIRHWMHALIEEELTAQGRPFRKLAGTFEEQLATAIGHIDQMLISASTSSTVSSVISSR